MDKVWVLIVEHNIQVFSTRQRADAATLKWTKLGWIVGTPVEVEIDYEIITQHPLVQDMINSAAKFDASTDEFGDAFLDTEPARGRQCDADGVLTTLED